MVEIPHERTRSLGVAGNIYKGRVKKVLPGMQSAFVDIGLERDAFLYVSDLIDDAASDWTDVGILAQPEEESAEAVRPAIEQRLSQGQELVVQVAKEPIAGKGARVTAHVTLPGRYLVYMPSVRHIGVSRRIEDADERVRLKSIIETIRDDDDGGYIVRTAAAGLSEDELAQDARLLTALWADLQARIEPAPAPSLVHRELALLEKLLRDLVAADFGEIIVDTADDHRRAVDFLSRIEPELVAKVQLYQEAETLFDAYGIEAEIERALRSRVWLKSGGYIVINQTEALVAVDVNTGRYVGRVCLEDTALKTNLEAAQEVVRQIRLRDLGGIIVVDFIDMEEASNRDAVVAALEQALASDRSKTKTLKISDLGLVEMTRKRVKSSLERTLSRACRCCGGGGRVKSPETVCYEIYRELRRATDDVDRLGGIEIRVHPEVEQALTGPERDVVDTLQRELGAPVEVRADAALGAAQYDFTLS